jgi:hypothetical protein
VLIERAIEGWLNYFHSFRGALATVPSALLDAPPRPVARNCRRNPRECWSPRPSRPRCGRLLRQNRGRRCAATSAGRATLHLLKYRAIEREVVALGRVAPRGFLLPAGNAQRRTPPNQSSGARGFGRSIFEFASFFWHDSATRGYRATSCLHPNRARVSKSSRMSICRPRLENRSRPGLGAFPHA